MLTRYLAAKNEKGKKGNKNLKNIKIIKNKLNLDE